MTKPEIRNIFLTAALAATVAAGLGGCEHKPPSISAPEKSSGAIEQPKDAGAASNDAVPGGGTSNTIVASNADNDAVLAARVKSALVETPELRTFTFDVSIANGVVMLYGTVDTANDRAHAGDIALNVPGVQAVRNNIQIAKDS